MSDDFDWRSDPETLQRADVPESRQASLAEQSPFLPVQIIGGQGGEAFSFYGGYDGAMVEKIGVWVGEWMIKAVKIWLTNGKIAQFGNASGPYSEFVFGTGELIKSMSLWGNGAGTRLGAIRFETNRDRSFFPKMTKWGLKQEYPIDTGSGICVGVIGRAGSDVDQMGFVFVKPISHSVMEDMQYPTIGFETPNVRVSQINAAVYSNNLDVPQTYDFKSEETLTRKESWSITAGMEFAFGYKVKAGLPEVAEVEKSFQFKVSVSGTYGQENTSSKTETWVFPITVPPHKTVEASISIGRADITLPYNASVRVTTTDGSELVFKVNGTYFGIAYTKVFVDVREVG
jgi:hypothetical protein